MADQGREAITQGTPTILMQQVEDMLDLPEGYEQKVEDYLNDINYDTDPTYVPSEFALEFIAFIKLVNGEEGEENKSPVIHFQMLDQVAYGGPNIANMCARGTAKTTLLGEYLFLYLGVYGKLPGFGKVNLALYVSDSIENGVKNMRKNLEHRWENSEFLKQYIPKTKFTDNRWEFQNASGNTLVVKGYGAKTGVRGTKEMGVRPQLAVLDDLVSDEDARSDTVIASIEDTVYKAVDYALHPTKSKTIWSGTPFNAKDPLYKAVESGAWAVNVYPICEKFPCERDEFKSCWPDRFDYNYVLTQHTKALKSGKVDTFDQELMLRIMSDEDRLIMDGDLVWYDRNRVLTNKGAYNFYITTDFATDDKTANDLSVISVWAYSNNGDWLWVDGVCEHQLMDKNIDDVFRFVQEYRPISVGIEISGQQKGFITWILNEMPRRNIFFGLAQEKNSSDLGLRPNTNKLQRFNVVVPQFKTHKIWFPEQLRHEKPMLEAMDEITKASRTKFKSKHDDFIDTISMLGSLQPWKPSQIIPRPDANDRYWEDWNAPEDNAPLEGYLV
jgi:predicted phage terminase large subunit-like protein